MAICEERKHHKEWCVYVYTNRLNGKVYVGISSNIERRWHNDGAEYLTKHSPFAPAINKYGWDGFDHEIVAAELSLEEANSLEKKLIKKYRSSINRFGADYGYNQTNGGDGTAGFPQYGEANPFWGKHHTDITKTTISIANKGRFVGINNANYGLSPTVEKREQISRALKEWYSINQSKSCGQVFCITDGKWFSSVKDASEYYAIQSSEISAVCLGKRRSTHGLQFTYDQECKEPAHTRIGTGREKQTEMMRKKMSIPVECIETGMIYESAKAAASEVNIHSHGDIGKCCKGIIKTSGGFHWRYAR